MGGYWFRTNALRRTSRREVNRKTVIACEIKSVWPLIVTICNYRLVLVGWEERVRLGEGKDG
jgi:hypothetical protein